MNRKVAISGKQGSGKSALAEELKVKAIQSGYSPVILKFADPLYEMHNAIKDVLIPYGIDFPRKDGLLLQLLGTEWGRTRLGENVWSNALLRKIANLEYERNHIGEQDLFIIVDDMRFENEFKALYNFVRVRLDCPEEVRKARCPSWRDNTEHPSETGLDAYAALERFDISIDTSKYSALEAAELVNERV